LLKADVVTTSVVQEEKGQAPLGTVTVRERARNFEPPPIAHPVRANLGGVAQLLGYDFEELHNGLRLTLYWQALAEMDTSYTVFIHLLGEDGRIWGQRDSVPGDGALPTTGWLPGEIIADECEVALAPDAPPGAYAVAVGWYEATTGKRLTVFDEGGCRLGDRLLLDKKVKK
jgi:hypothetical protein